MELQPDEVADRGLRRYVQLVAEALGMESDASYIELEPPACAYLALSQRLPRYPARDAALLWDERHGWSMAIESSGTNELQVQAYLGVDVLPAPRVVAHFAGRLLRGEDPDRVDPPHLRAPDVEDDLPRRLAAYARPAGHVTPARHAAVTSDGAARAPSRKLPPGPDLLVVRLERDGPVGIVRVSGDVDVVTAPQLQQSVNHALAGKPELLVLDLTGVTFLGSAGIAVLISAQDGQARHRTGVRVVADTPVVLRPLQVLGLTTVLAVYPTLPAALAGSGTGRRRPPAG